MSRKLEDPGELSRSFANTSVLNATKRISEVGLLTERQAQALVMLDINGWKIERCSDVMNVPENYVTDARQTAEEKLEEAKPNALYNGHEIPEKELREINETLKLIEDLESSENTHFIPRKCSECGNGLSRRTHADGRVMCPSCASEFYD